jgi:sugar/nucleoside kinase (ribokinase family)
MVVDTVGGSDAFCAALVVGMAEGKKFFEAVDMANAAGSLAVQTRGGYPSMPTRKQVNELLATHKTLK